MTELTSYEKTKITIRRLVGQKLTACEHSVCLYLLDQQFGYSADKAEIGESSGFGHISNRIDYSKRQVVRAIKGLVHKGIIIKETNATQYGNRYKFRFTSDSRDTATGDIHDNRGVTPKTPGGVTAMSPNNKISNTKLSNSSLLNSKDLFKENIENVDFEKEKTRSDDADKFIEGKYGKILHLL